MGEARNTDPHERFASGIRRVAAELVSRCAATGDDFRRKSSSFRCARSVVK